MIRRRALLAGGAAWLAAGAEARAQVRGVPPWYATGTIQREVRFAGADGVTLAGTLLMPLATEIQPVPGVVLIAGSGPTDRDGNTPLIPARIDTLKLIAARLAAVGIATLRYDKRGVGRSAPRPPEGLAAEERFFTWGHAVADAVAAHVELLRHDEIKPYATAFLGHSEGGLLALAAIAGLGPKKRPHALVLASTPGRPMADIVRTQIARTAPTFAADADRIVATILDSGRVPADIPAELRLVFPSYAGPFLRDLFAFDPAAALARIDTACLLIHGGADNLIVPFGDIQPLIDGLGKRSATGEALVVPAVSHNLKTVYNGTDPGYIGALAPAVGDKLAQWLGTVLGA